MLLLSPLQSCPELALWSHLSCLGLFLFIDQWDMSEGPSLFPTQVVPDEQVHIFSKKPVC